MKQLTTFYSRLWFFDAMATSAFQVIVNKMFNNFLSLNKICVSLPCVCVCGFCLQLPLIKCLEWLIKETVWNYFTVQIHLSYKSKNTRKIHFFLFPFTHNIIWLSKPLFVYVFYFIYENTSGFLFHNFPRQWTNLSQ